LDPVDHETTVTGACGDTIVCVDVVEVVVNVIPALDKVVIR
jgi:hypothetical protein